MIDLYSRRLLACPICEHPDAELVIDAIKIAAAVRGGRDAIDGVIFHTDRGSTYTAGDVHRPVPDRLGIRQSMGRVGSCFDNAAAEVVLLHPGTRGAVPPQLHHEGRGPRRSFKTWCHEFYNTRRRHSSAAYLPPAEFETVTADQPAAA